MGAQAPVLWEEYARPFAYLCGSHWTDDNKLVDRSKPQRYTPKVPYGFRHRHSSLMDSIYGSRQTLEEHDGIFQPVMTTMARSNLFSKPTISSRSGSGFRLSFFRSTNGTSNLQTASCLALQFLPTWSTAIVLEIDSALCVRKAMLSSGAPRQSTVTAPPRALFSLVEIFSNPFYLVPSFTHL